MAAEVILKLTGVDDASGVIAGVGDALGGLGGILQGALNVGIGVAVGGLTALAGGLAFSLGEAMEAEEGIARLNAVIESTGGKAGVTADMALDLADSLSGVTRFSDDAILAGENLLLTFTNIGADVFPQATEAMLNIAAAMGTDAKGAAVQLGKALNDPIAGMSALSRVGVSFTEEQKKAIEAMVEAGDVAGAQAIILGELEVEFGGAARAAGETFAGQMDIVTNSVKNAAEGVGTAFLPLLKEGAEFLNTTLVPAITTLSEGLALAISLLVSGEEDIRGASDAFAEFANDVLPGSAEGIRQFGGALQGVFDFVVANIPAVQATLQTVFDSIMIAVNAIWPVIVNDLLPAFNAVFTAIFGQAPTAQELLTGALTAISNGAVSTAAFFRDVLAPALVAFADWIVVTLVPVLTDVKAWLDTNLPIALQFLTDTWNNVLLPAITAVWSFITTSVIPAFTALWEYINTYIVPLLTALAGVTIEALRIAFEALVTYYNSTFAPMLAALNTLITTVIGPAFTSFTTWLSDVTGGIEGITSAIQSAIDWLNDLAEALSGISIPPNLTPGSPTPFENGLRGISRATRDLRGDLRGLGSDMARLGGPSFGGGPVAGVGGFTGARPGGAGGGTFSGDPVVTELRKAVALLEKIAVELDGDNRVTAELSVALA